MATTVAGAAHPGAEGVVPVAGHDLGHPVDMVLPDRHRLVRVVCGRHERLAEVPAGEDGNRLVEDEKDQDPRSAAASPSSTAKARSSVA